MSWTDACQSNHKVTKLYDSSFANITCEKVKDYKVIDYSRSEDAVYKLINFLTHKLQVFKFARTCET
ncbi:MAG TPA: hypothetical protein DDY12_01805 [Porphyromonadaceae bacterium]|nr:hypothetical protein [Porphyromonadaceae bacterium]